ncbi:MAG: L-serine ammonia-lyase, iron-sulfur-dependent subunit beta [Christensenellales bacterium]|nr:L-serine ammonia-lyase, iron-sulfur-dependent, subunit beta [Clostridiales bacterium]
MRYRSVFDIIGPVMIGPSSSHTAGAVRIGKLCRRLFGKKPDEVTLHFYESFAQTYRGHATDVAVIAGLLDLETDDERIPNAFLLAQEQNMRISIVPETAPSQHPNTVMVDMVKGKDRMRVTGISVGGGMVRIVEVDGFHLRLTGEGPTLLVFNEDKPGAIANVTEVIAKAGINISHMEVSRRDKGRTALMRIETDQAVDDSIVRFLEERNFVLRVAKVKL